MICNTRLLDQPRLLKLSLGRDIVKIENKEFKGIDKLFDTMYYLDLSSSIHITITGF